MRVLTGAVIALAWSVIVGAHDGPPFPIASDRAAGRYVVSIWTDPDATDDGSAGGQFWVIVRRQDGEPLPEGTSVRVAVRPLGRPGPEREEAAAPVRGDTGNQFAALVMDHEGPFAVRATVSGPLGDVSVDATADATYDLRPPAYMFWVYLLPFVLAGALWTRLLIRRRSSFRHTSGRRPGAAGTGGPL
jgi:hypothetical protein